MDDYYQGLEGARRLIKELDQLLQHMLNTAEQVEVLDCSIELQVAGGERLALNKTYRSQRRMPPAEAPTT